jgi:hypothetical protein
MMDFTELASAPSPPLAPFTDQLRLAVAAYLALLCSVQPWGKLGATTARAPCVTWDIIIRFHQAGR